MATKGFSDQLPLSAFPALPALSALPSLMYQHHDRFCIDLVMGTDNPLFLARFTKIVWRSQTRIEHPIPRLGQSVEDRKPQGVRRGVDHNIEILVAKISAPQVIGKTMRVKTKIGGGTDPTPADIVAPKPTPADARVRFTEDDHSLTEAKEICVSL